MVTVFEATGSACQCQTVTVILSLNPPPGPFRETLPVALFKVQHQVELQVENEDELRLTSIELYSELEVGKRH